VPIRVLRDGGTIIGAELTAPQALQVGPSASATDIAACLSLDAADIKLNNHPPQVLSVGLSFLVAELASSDALRRAKLNALTHEHILPPIATDAVFAYALGSTPEELHARMFSPLDGIPEDPATGSAAAATIALLATFRSDDGEIAWRIQQGIEMGRPSLLLGRTEKRDGKVTAVHIAGQAVQVMSGVFDL
jgi:trans-2,3-dihydro-3-hydroxyanthranilate isomerase